MFSPGAETSAREGNVQPESENFSARRKCSARERKLQLEKELAQERSETNSAFVLQKMFFK